MGEQFGIYVHWPFCASKCPYCDFNSHVADTIDHDAWRKAYAKEIAYYADLAKGRMVTSVFFGGGTPSLMEPETVSVIINEIQKAWRISNDCEITLEANPTSVETEKFKSFRMAGVNRVSMGVQSFNESDLAFLGRQHDAGEAKKAIATAAEIFDRYSFDMIYARPGQGVSAWETELREAVSLARDHLSVYQLTIERGTPFYMRHERGEFKIPDEELAGDLYEVTQAVLSDAGMPAYEISNHAKAGAESRHNMTYWRYTDYAGIGPGAHGRLTLDGRKQATRGHRSPDIWLQKVDIYGHGAHPFEALTAQDAFTECLMMGLRLAEGIPVERLERAGRDAFPNLIAPEKIEALRDEGLLSFDGKILKATRAGMQRLNGILSYLL
ncbi:MAG: radical SAM family heme chaperone HemW [Micavibrio sp.]